MLDVQSASPLPPITPRDPASSHSGLRYCYYVKDDVTRQCQYWCQCGPVREESQTGMESNYLFDPLLLRCPSPEPVDSVQTRQDATDVLLQPSLERLGGCTAAAVTIILPRVKTEHYIRNDGASTITTGNTTHDSQRGRRANGRGSYRCSRGKAVEVLGMKCPDQSNQGS